MTLLQKPSDIQLKSRYKDLCRFKSVQVHWSLLAERWRTYSGFSTRPQR